MNPKPNKKKTNFKGRFEPKIDALFKGMADEYGISVRYEPWVYPVRIEQDYVPDFELTGSDGATKIIECKGFFRYEDQRKVLAFRRDYPDVPYYMIFEKDNPIRKGAKMTYTGWATKHGIPSAIGTVPVEWLK